MYAQFMKPASREVRVSSWIRQFHRWTSIVFALTVIATTIALAQKEPVMWMSYMPLLPLALLSITGLCMFFRPYLTGRRDKAGA